MSFPVDSATFYRLLLHESHVHAVPNRRVEDLRDGILLLDPDDAEPFWNRLAGIRWPDEPDAFDRRLTEVSLRFAGAGRQPHLWLAPPHHEPADIQARLAQNGFEEVSRGLVMVARDPALARAALRHPSPPDVEVRRLEQVPESTAMEVAGPIVDVLLEAFAVGEDRRAGVILETLASLADPRFTHYIVLLGGTPAAVTRRATFDGITYLSSIGTRPAARGRGLGRLVTATAALDGFDAGSEFVHLGVFADNVAAIGLYERLGFAAACAPGPDMLLVR